MEEGAVQRIAEMAVQAAEANRIKTDTPAVIIGDDHSIASLEFLLEGRSRFRGKFATKSIKSFGEYVGRHADAANSAAFVNGERLSATAFINLGTENDPGHADWFAQFDVDKSAELKAVEKINGDKLSQRALAEWIEDWRHMLTGEANGEAQSAPQMAAAIRNVKTTATGETTSTARDFGASKSAFEEIEAKSAAGVLPTFINARLTPAEGFAERIIPMRLSVITGDKPGFILRIVAPEKLYAELGEELVQLLTKEIGGFCKVVSGSFTA